MNELVPLTPGDDNVRIQREVLHNEVLPLAVGYAKLVLTLGSNASEKAKVRMTEIVLNASGIKKETEAKVAAEELAANIARVFIRAKHMIDQGLVSLESPVIEGVVRELETPNTL